MTDQAMPPQIRMMQLLDGMLVSRAISVCAEFGIADLLADGPRSADELADSAGVNADGLFRVMRTLAGVGVFTALPDRRFENNELSACLKSDSPHSVRAIGRWLGHSLHWKVMGDLDYSVRTGEPALRKDHPDKSPLEILFGDPSAREIFSAAMTETSAAQHGPIIEAYDFSRFPRIVDVGGGHGTLGMMIAAQAPEVSINVFDLPNVVASAATEIEKRGLGDRMTATGGSFLEGVPGPADLFILKWILHLWSDEVSTQILKNCRASAAEGAHVLLVEMLLVPGPAGIPARSMDIEMLTGSGGRERTEEEFTALLEAAGFKLERIIETQTPMRLIEAVTAPAG